MVRVIIQRRLKEGKKGDILPPLRALRTAAMSYPGYIHGESLGSAEDPSVISVLSNWQSLAGCALPRRSTKPYPTGYRLSLKVLVSKVLRVLKSRFGSTAYKWTGMQPFHRRNRKRVSQPHLTVYCGH